MDLGVGASCIYPVLAAKKFGWKMIGTEKDKDSLKGRNWRKFGEVLHIVKFY